MSPESVRNFSKMSPVLGLAWASGYNTAVRDLAPAGVIVDLYEMG